MAEVFEHIKGYEALAKTLQDLPAKMESRILRGACRAAAKVIEAEVEKRIPHGKTGHLAASVRISTRMRNGTVTAAVKVGDRQAFYANMVDKGTRPHLIGASKAKRLRIGVTVTYPTKVQHPGAKARNFMQPSLEAAITPAVEAFRAYTERRLDKLTK